MELDWGALGSIFFFRAGHNTSVVMLGVTLLGLVSGLTGVFVLLRERAMVSDAVAHCTLPGLALAFLTLHYFSLERSYAYLLLGATLTGLIGLGVIHALSRYSRLAEETSIGAVLSVFFGLGIVLLSVIQSLGSGGAAGLSHFIYGHTASMLSADAERLVIVNSIALLVSALLFKEFRLLCFDSEFARVQGWSITFLDSVMSIVLLMVIIVGLQTVGMLLIVALLVIPATAARFWTNSLRSMIVIASFIGAASGYLGAAMSALLPNMPTGAIIVLCAGLFFVVSFLCAPQRGVLAGIYRNLRIRLRILREHVLREFYEEAEQAEQGQLASYAMSIKNVSTILLALPFFSRYVQRDSSSGMYRLTDNGVSMAVKLTRNHRLWELYMMEYAGLSYSHVDYSADIAEHVLSRDIISKLEHQLIQAGKLPVEIESAHPIGRSE